MCSRKWSRHYLYPVATFLHTVEDVSASEERFLGGVARRHGASWVRCAYSSRDPRGWFYARAKDLDASHLEKLVLRDVLRERTALAYRLWGEYIDREIDVRAVLEEGLEL